MDEVDFADQFAQQLQVPDESDEALDELDRVIQAWTSAARAATLVAAGQSTHPRAQHVEVFLERVRETYGAAFGATATRALKQARSSDRAELRSHIAQIGDMLHRLLDVNGMSVIQRLSAMESPRGLEVEIEKALRTLRLFVPQTGSSPSRARANRVGMSEQEKQVWEALNGRSLTIKGLATEIGARRDTTARCIRNLNKRGYAIARDRAGDHYRVDAPPKGHLRPPSP